MLGGDLSEVWTLESAMKGWNDGWNMVCVISMHRDFGLFLNDGACWKADTMFLKDEGFSKQWIACWKVVRVLEMRGVF